MSPQTLGNVIQAARSKQFKLREFARLLDISPTHLSDIENNRRIPSEELLLEISERLGLDPNGLLIAARRVPEETRRYVDKVPEAVSLFRKISSHQLDPDELKKLEEAADRLVKKRTKDE